MNQINMTTYIEHITGHWFNMLLDGSKTVEGMNGGKYKNVRIGETIEWINDDPYKTSIWTEIIGKSEYKKLSEYLLEEGLNNCLPGIQTIDDGLSVYYKYFTKSDESMYGVIALRLRVIIHLQTDGIVNLDEK